MNYAVSLSWARLQDVQLQVLHGVENVRTDCPIDVRYSEDWEKLLAYTSVAIGNFEGMLEEPGVATAIEAVIRNVLFVASALMEGQIRDLAECQHEGSMDCPMRARAQQVLRDRAR